MAVADDMHRRGVGTLLLEHLVSLARSRGVRTFVAETLTENALMMQVFADAGLGDRALVDGVYEVRFPLPTIEGATGLGTYHDAVAERERSADVASLRHVLTPASVTVIGASRRPGSVGRAILQNIIDGGFTGPVYAVNPSAAELDGVPCVPSAAALPEQVDLAVIAAPTAAVLGIAEDCGRRGVKALVVTTFGLDGTARAELLGICRRYGMRLVGPTCFGVANTAISLDATFAAAHPRPGMAGLALQSGARRRRPARAPVPGSASGSPPSFLSAIRTKMCPATTCCCGGSPMRRPGWPCSTWIRSGTRASSPGRPDVSRTMPLLTVHVGRSRRPASGRMRAEGGPASHPAGPVRAGRRDRHRQLRRATRRRGTTGIPAGARGAQGRRGVQYPRRRDARRRCVRRRGPAGRQPGRRYPAGASGPASRRCRGDRAGRYHGGSQVRCLPPVPGACRCRPGCGRGPGAGGHDRDQRPGARGARRTDAGADRCGGNGPG